MFYWNPQFESIEIESILKAETREREMNITLKVNEKETKRSQLKTTPQTLVKYPNTSLTTTPKPSEAGEKKTFKNLLKTAKKPDQTTEGNFPSNEKKWIRQQKRQNETILKYVELKNWKSQPENILENKKQKTMG